MNRTFLLLLVIVLCIGFVSCGDNDDNEKSLLEEKPDIEDTRPDDGVVGWANSLGELTCQYYFYDRFIKTNFEAPSTPIKLSHYFRKEDGKVVGIAWELTTIVYKANGEKSDVTFFYSSYEPAAIDKNTYKDYFYKNMIYSPSRIMLWGKNLLFVNLPADGVSIAKKGNRALELDVKDHYEASFLGSTDIIFTGFIIYNFHFDLDKK